MASHSTTSSHSSLSAELPVVPLPSTPLSSLPPSHRPLFVYYRSRIETFEAERQDILSRITALTQQNKPTTATNHSPATLTATLATVERERSEQRVQASEERRRRLECEAAMRAAMAERLVDKKRVAQLLALTLPKRTAQQQFIQRNLPPPSAHNKENQHNQHDTSKRTSDTDEWRRLLSAEKEAREASDREWRRQVDVLTGERRRREKEWEERERQLVGWEEEARRERDKARVDLHEVMSEYMQLRHTAQHNERIALERITTMAAQHNQTLAHLRSHTHPHLSTTAATTGAHSLLASTASRSTSTRERGEEYDRPWSSGGRAGRVVDDRIIEYYTGDMHDLIARNSQLNHRLRQLQDEHKREQQRQQQLYGSMNDDCQRWKIKYERECERRALQCEGYETDVRRMRERLWGMEELIVQMGRGGRVGVGGGSGGVDVGDVLHEMDVAGMEAEIGAMDRQLTTLTARLALSDAEK